MSKKFTASEVRTETQQSFRYRVNDMLYAYADLLEAQEKAVPVAWCDPATIDCAHPTCYKKLEYISIADSVAGVKFVPLYTHPALPDAERLAEALRSISNDANDTGNKFGSPDECIESIARTAEEALATHSAQAQPPVVSVLDGVNQGLLIGTSPDGRPYAMRGTPESVAVVSAMLEHAGTSQQLTMESGNG